MDIRNAYLHIPIFPPYQGYLHFCCGQTTLSVCFLSLWPIHNTLDLHQGAFPSPSLALLLRYQHCGIPGKPSVKGLVHPNLINQCPTDSVDFADIQIDPQSPESFAGPNSSLGVPRPDIGYNPVQDSTASGPTPVSSTYAPRPFSPSASPQFVPAKEFLTW